MGTTDPAWNLQVYYHGLPDRYPEDRPIKVYYDHVVIAKERIGCINVEEP